MFPESFAEQWIEQLTEPGQTVLDPFAGRGTAPFQALLMGREAIAGDTNPVAYCVTRAKLRAPKGMARVRRRLNEIQDGFCPVDWQDAAESLPEFFRYAYHPRTLVEVVYLRQALRWRRSDTDCMIAALILGSLHGEVTSGAYLSNQMPRTISTKPAYSIRWWRHRGLEPPERDTFGVLRSRLAFRYESERPPSKGRAFNCDVRSLPLQANTRAHLAITSPPYLDITNYEEDQWLRLWFLGGVPHPTTTTLGGDDRHTSEEAYSSFLAETWRALSGMLHPDASVVMRIGAKDRDPEDLVALVGASHRDLERRVEMLSWDSEPLTRRQTRAFRPGARGCEFEIDLHFRMR